MDAVEGERKENEGREQEEDNVNEGDNLNTRLFADQNLAGAALGIIMGGGLATTSLNKDFQEASFACLVENVYGLSKKSPLVTIDQDAAIRFLEVVLLQAQ